MRTIWIILFLFLLLISCEKKKDDWTTIIEGQLSDYYTGAKLSNIGLIIEECQTPLVTSTYCKIIDTIYTDISGDFYHVLTGTYSGKLFDNKDYQISVLSSNNYANSDIKEIIIDKSNYYNFSIKPLRMLKLILHDSSAIYDKLEIHTMFSEYTENNDISFNNFIFHNTILEELNSADTISMKCVPESNINITLTYFDNGIYKGYRTTKLYVEDIELEVLNINY